MKQIYEHDIAELEIFYPKFPNTSNQGTLTPALSNHHPELGSFQVSNLAFQNLCMMDIQWSVPDELMIHESRPSQTVDVNFILEGNVKGNFKGLAPEFMMHGGTSNLKYTPAEKSTHHAIRQDAKMFVIALDKDYFCDLIGHDNHWAGMVQEKMLRQENFLASKNFLSTTPQMQGLIHSIQSLQPGPMSRLLTQSMVFELLARQIEQLTKLHHEAKLVDDISVLDIEKLHFIKQYIDRNFLEELTLTSLCREAMLNEFKLKKGFKALFGNSVIQYARALRMQYAQTLLRDHRVSIEEVSSRLGYQYPNHFSVAYKKYFGVSPVGR